MSVVLPPHDILSPFHLDTLTDTVVRGDVLYGNDTPKWARLPKPMALSDLSHDGTDVTWQTATGTGAPVRATSPVFTSSITLPALTSGSVVFAGVAGLLSQDNARFFWDDTNHRLGVGLSAPANVVDITGPAQPALISTTPGTAASGDFQVAGGGIGGNTDIATTGVGGIGANITMISGVGGVATAAATSSTGGRAGNFTLAGGVGGAASVAGTGTNTGGVGGAYSLAGGTGGAATGNTSGTNTGGVGGAVSVTGGTGGAATTGSGSLVGGQGGGISFTGGTGGTGATGATGGACTISGGTGGATTAGGTGGGVLVQGGAAASVAGAIAGAATLAGRAGFTTGTGGQGGAANVTGGNAGGDDTVNRAGGTVTITSGNSKGSTTAATLALVGGTGGAGTGTTGAVGAAITITPGPGGVGSATGGAGGALTLRGGLGGDSTADGAGGAIIFETATTITRAEVGRFIAGGQFGLGVTAPTAILHLKAGTATANTSPFKMNSGPLLTVTEAGAWEFLTDGYYVTTTTGTIRRMIVAGSTGRAVAQTAAVASVAAYTLGATDASYEVSANVLVTTATLHNFTVTVAYTDEGNTARTVTLNFQILAGTIGTAIANAGGAVPYEGIPIHLRCKASTAITIATVGTFTTVTYNVEGVIKQIG